MKRLFGALIIAAALLTPALALDASPPQQLSVAELQQQAPALHPAALYELAARLLAQGKGQEAANWMYAGQLRYRFLLEAEGVRGSDEVAVFDALSEQVGRPVNEYIAGNVDEWLAAMDWALQWDAAHDNGTTSKTEYAEALATTRSGLEALRTSVEERRDLIPQERIENGLENR